MNPQRKRPLGITLLALPFLWIGCFGTLIFPIMIVTGGVSLMWDSLTSTLIHSHAFRLVGLCLFSLTWFSAYVLYAFIGFGLWKLRKWSLQAAIILQWVGIMAAVTAAIVFAKAQTVLAISTGVFAVVPCGAILWYLNQAGVRYAFETGGTPSEVPILDGPPLPLKPQHSLRTKIVVFVTAGVLAVGVFAGGLFYTVEKMFRSSEPYRSALARAQDSPCIVGKLGSPIVAKGMISGSISESSSDGSAEMEIPVRGPRGEGELDVSAKEASGTWTTTSLDLIYDAGQIHLLPVASPCQ